MNQELRDIFKADQADRQNGVHSEIWERDQVRRSRVEELIQAGALQTPEDYFHAAMIFQHGQTLDDYWRAHEFARKASELGHKHAKWLAAAAYDRWLMHQGKPQKYGTQYRANGERWVLYEVDPATTDEERLEWSVIPLAQALRRAEEMTEQNPPAKQSGSTLGSQLASCEMPGLRVEIFDLIQAPPHHPEVQPEPLDPDDKTMQVPGFLPHGLTLCRWGRGYGATDLEGQIAVW